MTGDKNMVRAIKIGVTMFAILCAVKGTLDLCRATGCGV